MSWQSSRPSLFSSVGLLVVHAFLADCRRPSVEDSRRGEREHSAAPVCRPSGSQVNAADVAPPAPARAEVYAGWAESTMYSLRLGEIRRCGPETPLRLGMMVNVVSRIDGLLLAPRDFTLTHGGVILQTEGSPKPEGPCRSLLMPRSVRKGEVASGMVIFALPDESYARPARLTYQATRWGGAPALAVPLPACLDDCPPARMEKSRPTGH
jgi:hypothetical protein